MTSELLVEDRSVVTPGEEIAKGMDFLPASGTFRDGDIIVANKTGLLRVDGQVLKVVALSGEYIPKKNDNVIGRVDNVLMSGWILDIASPYNSVLNSRDGVSGFVPKDADLTKFFKVGDYVMVRIFNVTSQKLVDVSTRGPGLGKLQGGRIVRVNTNKVPRIIGKQGSMVSMIKEATNTQISVGQNGIVWIKGDDIKLENLAAEAIYKIERESHHKGLTDTMSAWLEENKK